MKVAISIPDDIFQAVDRLARLGKTSRSSIFVRAVREHLKRLENKDLLTRLDEAWAEPLTDDEQDALRMGQELTWEALDEEPHES